MPSKYICCMWDKQVCLPLHTQKSSSNISIPEELQDRQRHADAHGWSCPVPWLGKWNGSYPDTPMSPLRFSPPGRPLWFLTSSFSDGLYWRAEAQPKALVGMLLSYCSLGNTPRLYNKPRQVIHSLCTACVLLPSQTSSTTSRNERFGCRRDINAAIAALTRKGIWCGLLLCPQLIQASAKWTATSGWAGGWVCLPESAAPAPIINPCKLWETLPRAERECCTPGVIVLVCVHKHASLWGRWESAKGPFLSSYRDASTPQQYKSPELLSEECCTTFKKSAFLACRLLPQWRRQYIIMKQFLITD